MQDYSLHRMTERLLLNAAVLI